MSTISSVSFSNEGSLTFPFPQQKPGGSSGSLYAPQYEHGLFEHLTLIYENPCLATHLRA